MYLPEGYVELCSHRILDLRFLPSKFSVSPTSNTNNMATPLTMPHDATPY